MALEGFDRDFVLGVFSFLIRECVNRNTIVKLAAVNFLRAISVEVS